ncbi:MAG: lipoate--protein ligase [Angelakisella sp.]
MINRIAYVTTDNTVPYENIALEELLLDTVLPQECILYLWQNRRTVVIGRNQNCRGECRMAQLEADGGYLARRLSGGGAVFHDMGNLNFTFLVQSEDYDLDRQLEVILRAVRSLGIAAEKSGRNDITADGRKFSGNAFYTKGNRKYHHGTIMIDADLDNLSRYLTVSPDKLAAKGVKSVRSRVINLRELNPAVTVESVKTALIAAFGELYGLCPLPLDSSRIDREERTLCLL